MAARRYRPFVQDDLRGPDPGGAPWRIRTKQPMHSFDIIIKYIAVGGHGVFHPHDKLHIGAIPDLAPFPHVARCQDMGQIERLDLWLHPMRQHFRRQPIHQIRRVFIDPGREIVRPDRQRRHVGPQRQHTTPRLPCARSPPGGQLHDHAGAMRLHPLFQPGEPLGVRRGQARVIAHMGVDNAGPGLKRRMGAFNLFRDGDRHRRVVGFGWQRPGDGNADDAGGVGHGRKVRG